MNIQLTEKAVERLTALLKNDPFNTAVTLSVVGSGCSGYSYKLDIVKQEFVLGGFDLLEGTNANSNFNFYVDRTIVPLINGLVIDYVSDGLNQKFEFKNPQETARCGCGSSFTV